MSASEQNKRLVVYRSYIFVSFFLANDLYRRVSAAESFSCIQIYTESNMDLPKKNGL